MPVDTALVLRRAGPDRRVDDVRARLALARVRTHEVLAELRVDLPRRADWREWYRKNPEILLGTAFFVGFVLGTRR